MGLSYWKIYSCILFWRKVETAFSENLLLNCPRSLKKLLRVYCYSECGKCILWCTVLQIFITTLVVSNRFSLLLILECVETQEFFILPFIERHLSLWFQATASEAASLTCIDILFLVLFVFDAGSRAGLRCPSSCCSPWVLRLQALWHAAEQTDFYINMDKFSSANSQ